LCAWEIECGYVRERALAAVALCVGATSCGDRVCVVVVVCAPIAVLCVRTVSGEVAWVSGRMSL
jgi:hypothetical protein